MRNTFQPLYTNPTTYIAGKTQPFRYVDFDNFNLMMSESCLDIETCNRQGNEILLEAVVNGCSDEVLGIINEGVVGTVIEKIRTLIKAIYNFIKGLIDKMNLFADSMTNNINKWLKKVAPTALEKSKEAKYISKLSTEGYYYDEVYLSDGLYGILERVMDYSVGAITIEFNQDGSTKEVKEEIKASPKDTAEFIKKKKRQIDDLFSFARKVKNKEPEEKPSATKDNSADGKTGKDEAEKGKDFNINIPEPVKSTGSETKAVPASMPQKPGRIFFKDAIERFFKTEFNSTKEQYESELNKKAHKGMGEAGEITKYSSGTISSHIKFIEKSPSIIKKINERYTELFNQYNEIDSALATMKNEGIEGGDVTRTKYYNFYIMEIKDCIAFMKEATAINNSISRNNIRLVEECTKQYIKVCNKLAMMNADKVEEGEK